MMCASLGSNPIQDLDDDLTRARVAHLERLWLGWGRALALAQQVRSREAVPYVELPKP